MISMSEEIKYELVRFVDEGLELEVNVSSKKRNSVDDSK